MNLASLSKIYVLSIVYLYAIQRIKLTYNNYRSTMLIHGRRVFKMSCNTSDLPFFILSIDIIKCFCIRPFTLCLTQFLHLKLLKFK